MAQWKLGGQLCRSGDDLLASSCSAWSSTIARNRPGPTPSICWTIFYIWYISLVSIFSLACKILFVCTTIYIYIYSFFLIRFYLQIFKEYLETWEIFAEPRLTNGSTWMGRWWDHCPSGISGSSPIAGWFISWKILLKWMRGYPYRIFFRDFHLFQSVEDSFLWNNAGQFHGDLGLASLCSSPWPVPRRTGRDRFLGGTQLPQVFVTLW